MITQQTENKKTFRQFRVESICSTFDPDAILNEAGLDDFVAGKVTSGAGKAKAKVKAGASKVKAGASKAKAFGVAKVKSGASKVKSGLKKLTRREEMEMEEKLNEQPIIDAMKSIVKKGQYQKVKLGDGNQINVDMMTAGAIVKVYDSLNARNKAKFTEILYKNRAGFTKMSSFAIKNVSY